MSLRKPVPVCLFSQPQCATCQLNVHSFAHIKAASGVQLTEDGVRRHIIVHPWLTSFISPAITWDAPPASLSVAMSNETRRYTSLWDSIKLKVGVEGRVCIAVKIDVCGDIAV